MIDRPPCWPEGQRCPNDCAKQLHERVVRGTTPLYGPWAGWRMAGRFLISPGRLRAVPDQLAHLMFMASLHDR